MTQGTTPSTRATPGDDGPPPAGPRRMPLWARVLLRTFLVLLVIGSLGVVLLVSIVVGGLDDLFGSDAPAPDDPEVVEAHDAAGKRLAEVTDDLLALADDPAQLAAATDGDCREGQHNWKIDDPYDLTCTRVDVVLVEGGTPDTFRDDMTSLDAALLAAGWEAGWSSMTSVLTGYWDDRDDVVDANRDSTYPAQMPSVSYVRDDVTLSVSWVQPGATSAGNLEHREDVRWATPDGELLMVSQVPEIVAEGAYGTAFTVSVTYFEE